MTLRLIALSFLSLLFIGAPCFAGGKINSQGHFLPYPGVTVISNPSVASQHFWASVHDGLTRSSIIQKNYALLPLKSYHLTTTNLFAHQEYPIDHWHEFIDQHLPWFQKIHHTLSSDPFQLKGSFKSSLTSGVIMVLVQLGDHAQRKIQRTAEAIHMTRGVPSEFHVTLAYLYTRPNPATMAEIQKEVGKILEQALKKYGDPLEFDPPQLNSFRDMTEFTPWDGQHNPF